MNSTPNPPLDDDAGDSRQGANHTSDPIIARIVDPTEDSKQAGSDPIDENEIRHGSPFKPHSNRAAVGHVHPSAAADELGNVSVATETARGAVIAGFVILPLAAISVLWFPLGAIAVAGLGALMGLIGTSSRSRKLALSVLILHFIVLGFAYSRVV